MHLTLARKMFDLTKKLSLADLQEFRKKYALLIDLSSIATINMKPMNRQLIQKRLDAAGLRSTGDKFVVRTIALRHLGLLDL